VRPNARIENAKNASGKIYTGIHTVLIDSTN
jgi:hypothetical protein